MIPGSDAMRRLRVLYLAVWYPYPPATGSQIRSARLADALAARHELSLIGYARAGESVEALLPPASTVVRWQIIDQPAFERSRLRSAVGWLSPRPRHVFAMDRSRMLSQAQDWSRSEPFDIVIASTMALAEVALKLPARAHVVEEHNFMGRMLAEQSGEASGILQRLRTRLRLKKDLRWERKLFARFDLVTMVSELDLDSALAAGCRARRVAVVPNGVDIEACHKLAVQARRYRLVYPGSVTYSANLEAVTWFVGQVWPELYARHPKLRFTITGSTAGVDVAALAAVPGIEFTGHVDDVRSLVKSSTICVVPLRAGGGTRLKVLEAMALGVPVVATTKAVEGLAVEAGRHYLQADDASTFIRQVEALLEDETLQKILAEHAGQQVARHYDWQVIGPAFAEFVASTCRS